MQIPSQLPQQIDPYIVPSKESNDRNKPVISVGQRTLLTACLCGLERMDNFKVGLTNNRPDQLPPTTHGYSMCGQYPGAVPREGTTLFIQCSPQSPSARFVIILAALHMNICELEVFEAGRQYLCCIVTGEVDKLHS